MDIDGRYTSFENLKVGSFVRDEKGAFVDLKSSSPVREAGGVVETTD